MNKLKFVLSITTLSLVFTACSNSPAPHQHDWGEPSYFWSEDHSACQALRVCLKDESHIETEIVDSTYEVVTEPSYESEGEGRYVATFTNPVFETQYFTVTIDRLVNDGSVPVFSKDGKFVTYGTYPQTRITDEDLLIELEENADWLDSGYYIYNDEYYAKAYASPYNENYHFDDGGTINKYSNYWFKYEPVTWKVLSTSNNKCLLVSDLLLDAHYYSYSNKNNYANSSIRDWLNETFYSRAFALGNEYILTTTVDNSAASTASSTNQYACDDTEDKVFLLSFVDYTNTDYGFVATDTAYSSTRYCKTTDFARVNGGYSSTSEDTLNNGMYWTRSPNSGNIRYAMHVRSDGFIDYDENVNSTFLCVRPAIIISTAVE